jgi:hypothetical protein
LPKTKTGLSKYFHVPSGFNTTYVGYDCTEVLPQGIWKSRPCMESREVLPEAAKGYEGSEMRVLLMIDLWLN